MKNKKRNLLIITIFLILQTIIYIICGIHKSYIHMDEAYSLGLASYDKTEIQNNEDFYNTWHTKDYYEDYLSVQEEEMGQYGQVYENQKNDVHPPLYYLLLRFAMGFSKNHFSKWPGIVINMMIYLGITVFMYFILRKLWEGHLWEKEKSMVLAFVSSITMASLTNVIYIRMYALSTLMIVITTFLHIKLLKSKQNNLKWLIGIGVFALLGSLTHYYYLFYLAALYIMFAIKYIKEKDLKALAYYTGAIAMAAIASIIIFPYSIQHMFFGYRGQGVISNLLDISNFLKRMIGYLYKINCQVFNNLLLLIIIAMIGILIVNKRKKKENEISSNNIENNQVLKIISIPTIFYLIIVAIASPWIELRYIMPVGGLIFVLVMYAMYQSLKTIFSEKKSNFILGILCILLLIAPFIFKIEPEVLYSNQKEIVQKLETEYNIPTLYLFNSQNNRFLDDILLFSKLNQSYIAKDLEYTEENIQNILEGKDISNGIIVFINEGQNNDSILEVVKNATGLKNDEYMKRLNACDVYYIKK